MPELIRLAMIDDASRYAFYLGDAISNILKTTATGDIRFYLPKSKLFGKPVVSRLPFGNSKGFWSSFLYPFQIWRRALIDKVNVVHIQFEFNTFGHPITLAFFPLLLAGLRAAGISIVITIHGVIPRSSKASASSENARLPKTFLLILLIWLYRLINMLSSDIIVHSEVFKNWLIDYTSSANKISVIPHGVVTDNSVYDDMRMDYWLKKTQGKRVILCFGVLSPRKGLESLIKAYEIVNRENPDTVLVLAGYEPVYFKGYKKKLQNLTRDKGLENKIIFTGPVSEADIAPLFIVAEIVVIPYKYSISASGPLSIALQYAKPIVATDTIFLKNELIDRTNGILAQNKNFLDLASSINMLLTSETLRGSLSRGAKATALRTSWQKIAKITVSIYAAKVGDIVSQKNV
jgi:glycosyltransferase involved in cell wall biosynthesis